MWDVFANSRLRLPVQASEAAWHPSENLLALALRHGVVELWDINESVAKLHLSLFEDKPVQGLVVTADGYVDGPSDALQYVRFADGLALYDLEDLPERHDPERVRQAMAILSP